MSLLTNIEKSLNQNVLTANGAVTNKSSLDKSVDYFSLAGAMRNSPQDAVDLFIDAYNTNPTEALKILFYLRDIRGGQGERQHFRNVWDWLMLPHPTIDNNVLSNTRNNAYHIPEFGRWDDLLRLVIHPALSRAIERTVKTTLQLDCLNSEYDQKDFIPTEYLLTEKPSPDRVSLLAKWMPSLTASNKDVQQSAKDWCDRLNLTQKQYRKMLKHLRSHLNVVEQKMCSKNWSDIDYASVPSQAMLRLRNAFQRNDADRWKTYINKLEEGEEKVNASTLYPHQIVTKLLEPSSEYNDHAILESQWKALPEYGEPQNILCVCDVSGSMDSLVDRYTQAVDVAIALTLYTTQRCTPEWANKFITFSENPELQEINPLNSLKKQIDKLTRADWGCTTNIEKVFDLILANTPSNEVLPDTIMIISDMEFNEATEGKTNYEGIDRKFKLQNLTPPNLVFWNVMARGNNYPVTINNNGTAMVSGFSPAILQMCFAGDISPRNVLETLVLKNPRYDLITA